MEKTETVPLEQQKAVPVEDKAPAEVSTSVPEEKVETIPDKLQTPTSQPTENRVVYRGSISIKDSLKGEAIKSEQSEKVFGDEPAEIHPVEDNSGFPDSKLLLQSWNDYAQSIEFDHPRVYSTLKSHQPDIDSEGKMKILLNSEAQKENFDKNIKPNLIDYFNKKFGAKDFIFDVIIEANNVSEKKVYTDQDKFDYLLSKNPELGKLKTLFNLDFDN